MKPQVFIHFFIHIDDLDHLDLMLSDLSELAKKHNIAIWTATQIKSNESDSIAVPRNNPNTVSDIIFTDYLNLIKP